MHQSFIVKYGLAHQLESHFRHLEDKEEQNEPLHPLDERVDNAQREDEGWIDNILEAICSVFNHNDNPLDSPKSYTDCVHAYRDNGRNLEHSPNFVDDESFDAYEDYQLEARDH